MNPNKSPILWKRAGLGIERLSNDDHIRQELDHPLASLKKAFDAVATKAVLSDPYVAVKLWALSQIQNEMISVPGFRPLEFTTGQGLVDAMVAPVHDSAEYSDVIFDTRVVKLVVDASATSSASMNGIDIYGIHIGFPVVDFDQEMQGSGKLLTVTASGLTSALHRPLVGDVSVFVVSNTKSGIHKAYQVDILHQDSDEISHTGIGPVVREQDSIQLKTMNGLLLKITMLTGETLNEVVAELSASERAIAQYASNRLSDDERAAVQSTLTGFGMTPSASDQSNSVG